MPVPTKSRLPLSTPLSQLKHQMGGAYPDLPSLSVIAGLMKHGGFQILTSADAVTMKLNRALAGQPSADLAPSEMAETADAIQASAQAFFYKLSPNTYVIPVSLMSYLTFPHEGKTFTADPTGASPDPCGPAPKHPTAKDGCENPVIPAVFTFVGQFIDHDLTFNGLDLFIDEAEIMKTTPTANIDFATPLIDLDSVYGPRFHADGKTLDPTMSQTDTRQVYNGDMTFRYRPVLTGAGAHVPWGYDLYRAADGSAFIFDPRNDENQLILHIHLLVMRLHNKILKAIYAAHPGISVAAAFQQARQEVVATWQSVLLHDYLPRVIQAETLDFVLTEVRKPGHGALLHRPSPQPPINGVPQPDLVNMPHEFAIGFRFGHSQLRSAYVVNGGAPIKLFVRNPQELDLRGSRILPPAHVVDWNVFYPAGPVQQHLSLRIDSKVTHVVFDLPESAIPDNIKYVGNLPQRNLIRSRQINLACGEDLAYLYDITPLTPDEVDPCKASHVFFEQDSPTPAGPTFKTPLWYYLLREAELLGVKPTADPAALNACASFKEYPAPTDQCPEAGGYQLGPLGSRLVAEVIIGGIFYGQQFPWHDTFKSSITNTSKVCLRDIIDFVGPQD